MFVLACRRNCGLLSQFLPLDVVLEDFGRRETLFDGTDRWTSIFRRVRRRQGYETPAYVISE